MEGKYVITKGDESIGSLEVKKQGGYTVFCARCAMQPGLLRLSVYGEGKEAYLGLAVPAEGELRLEKKLSNWDMKNFPAEIEWVGPSGMTPGKAEKEGISECAEEKETQENEQTLTGDTDGPFWYAAADGALVSIDSGRQMVALPSDDGRVPKNIPGESRIIEGKEYLVYITKELGY